MHSRSQPKGKRIHHLLCTQYVTASSYCMNEVTVSTYNVGILALSLKLYASEDMRLYSSTASCSNSPAQPNNVVVECRMSFYVDIPSLRPQLNHGGIYGAAQRGEID